MTAMRTLSSGTVLRLLCGAALLIASLAGASSVLAHPSTRSAGKIAPSPRPQEGNITVIAGQPLRILVGSDGSLQVYHQKYTQGATYGTAGSGFFIAVGQTVYGAFYTPFTPM